MIITSAILLIYFARINANGDWSLNMIYITN